MKTIIIALFAVCQAAFASTAANVYVQTSTGIYACSYSSAGALTQIKGSPFTTTDTLQGMQGHLTRGMRSTSPRDFVRQSDYWG